MSQTSSPQQVTERALAPDLARGGMLLLIAVANAPWFLWGREHGPGSIHPTDGGVVDTVVQSVIVIAVDQRTYPMFAFLFGYGMVQFYRSRERRGFADRPIRRMLRQRHWAMLAIGLVHAALLWFGDVVGAYGLSGLILVWLFFRRKTRTLKIWLWILAGLATVGVVMSLIGGWAVARVGGMEMPAEAGISAAVAVNGIASYPRSIVERLIGWASGTAAGLMSTCIPIFVAWLWARAGVLDDPGSHLRLLRRVAAIGIPVGWLGAVPSLLMHLQLLPEWSDSWWAFLPLQAVTGVACGIGYVSLYGLLAHRIMVRGRRGWVARVLEAVGQNSLTCYLGQSVILAPLLAAWGFGVGGWLGSTAVAVIAVVTWAVWAVVAMWLTERGRRGPAEWVLRRLTNAGVPRPDPRPGASVSGRHR